jgi:hypothetical protein
LASIANATPPTASATASALTCSHEQLSAEAAALFVDGEAQPT